MAEAGGLEKQCRLTSAMIRTALSANRMTGGITFWGARAAVMAEGGGFFEREHGPGRAVNVVAIVRLHSTMSRTRGQRA